MVTTQFDTTVKTIKTENGLEIILTKFYNETSIVC